MSVGELKNAARLSLAIYAIPLSSRADSPIKEGQGQAFLPPIFTLKIHTELHAEINIEN
jgi:hypothetical protein